MPIRCDTRPILPFWLVHLFILLVFLFHMFLFDQEYHKSLTSLVTINVILFFYSIPLVIDSSIGNVFLGERRIILICSGVHHQVTSILHYKEITTNYIQILIFTFKVLVYHVFLISQFQTCTKIHDDHIVKHTTNRLRTCA
jgi:hypothetical protein